MSCVYGAGSESFAGVFDTGELYIKDGLCFNLIDLFLGNLLRTLLMRKLHGMLFFAVRMYLSCTQRGNISHSII